MPVPGNNSTTCAAAYTGKQGIPTCGAVYTWTPKDSPSGSLMTFYHIGAISANSIIGLIVAAQIQTITAGQITVGDGLHAACDTFFFSNLHARNTSHEAGVGACKVTACRYNSDLECSAEAILVGIHDRHADCMTFTPR